MNYRSLWLDFQLQKLKTYAPTNVRDTSHLLEALCPISDLLSNTFLFTVNAESMYINPDTKNAIQVINLWIDMLSTGQTSQRTSPSKQ